MSNLEHLVENGLYTLKKCDDYDEWLKQMRKDPNWEGIERLTIDDLWEICQYIYCRWLDELSIYIAEQTEPQKKMCANCKHIKKHNGKLADYVCDRKGSVVTNPYDKECDEMWEQTERGESDEADISIL